MARIPGSASRPSDHRVDLVGLGEIALLLDVPRATVDKWRERDVLPEPGWDLLGGPVWTLLEIRSWARATGRDEMSPNGRTEP